MAENSSGELKKLTISPCIVDGSGNISVDLDKKKFEVMINPSGYNHEYSIKYTKNKTPGETANDLKFNAMESEKVSCELVIDGTGVVDFSSAVDVKSQVVQLEDAAYNYDGEKHEPNYVRLLWGSFIFVGRLESMSIEYTLFKPSGAPLRAKVNLVFFGFMSLDEQGLRARRSSPDLTHTVEVRAGDTLPLLCHRIYKDSSYYADVAKINNIVNFRALKPGTRLEFPPLR